MPYRMSPGERGDAVVAAVYGLIAEAGTDAVTMRAIAGRVGISVGTLANNFRYKAYLMKVATFDIGRDLTRDLDWRTRRNGLEGFLPHSADEVEAVGVWLALRSLGRVSPEVGDQVEGIDAAQRELLRLCLQQLEDPPVRVASTDPVVTRVWTLLQGLWMELSRPHATLTTEDARALLQATVEARA